MENQEIWKDIPNYEGYYQVSSFGRVKSLLRRVRSKNNSYKFLPSKFKKQTIDNDGYLTVNLCINGKSKIRRTHQLVAVCFLNHKISGCIIVVDHINNIKTDNRVENLQLITNRENSSKDKKGYTSNYIGVSWSKPNSKWVAKISVNRKLIYLGYFDSEVEASNKYNKKLLETNNG